jgi:hypothetical protein
MTMTVLPPSVADLQAIRKALPHATEVINPENTVIREFAAGKVDKSPYHKTEVVDGYQGGKDRFDQVLSRQADQTARIVEKFDNRDDMLARLKTLVNGAGKPDTDVLRFKKKKEGSYQCDYVEKRQVVSGDDWDSSYVVGVKGKTKIKVVNDTTLVAQDTKFCPRNDQEEYIPYHENDDQIFDIERPSSIEDRLLKDEAVVNLVDACKDRSVKKLPYHTSKQLAEAAELAVVQGQPELVARFMNLTGKTPSLSQQNKLMSLATTEEDKQALKNIFMNQALYRFRAAYNGELKGRALVEALAQIAATGVPREGTQLATYIGGLDFKRVQQWTDSPSWKEYLASRQNAPKGQLEADVESDVPNKKLCRQA